MLFSQKHGYKPVKSVMQVDTMDEDLRNGLWNALYTYYLREINVHSYFSGDMTPERFLCHILWQDYFKRPLDTMPDVMDNAYREIRDYYFACEWFEVYDLIQFIANRYYDNDVNSKFMESCNSILEREVSGWRFIGGEIAPITSEEEIAEIEKALVSTNSLKPVATHIKTALDFLSDKKTPDYRNSIKESISAVEAICRLITGKDDATLGQALKVIKAKITVHPALEQAFSKLYGYTSDADGIRHSLLDEPDIDFEDAKFMLVSCSAFINYLKLKSSKAGLKL
jgi:hypothetical protein